LLGLDGGCLRNEGLDHHWDWASGARPAKKAYMCACENLYYHAGMDVAVSALRANLSEWLDRARAGDEIVVTDRGMPVARLTGIGSTPLLERLTAEGVIGRPGQPLRSKVAGRARPKARGSLAGLLADQGR
jgi:prevent-host-death family protein